MIRRATAALALFAILALASTLVVRVWEHHEAASHLTDEPVVTSRA